MTDRVFVDTSVLLYRFEDIDATKQQRAREGFSALWDHAAGRISWQVVFEFYANATHKSKVSPDIARAAVSGLLQWKPELPGPPALERAWRWLDTAQINFWDALIRRAGRLLLAAQRGFPTRAKIR